MSKCILGDGRDVAPGSKTQRCSCCLAAEARARKRTVRQRMERLQNLKLQERRLADVDEHPEGFKNYKSGEIQRREDQNRNNRTVRKLRQKRKERESHVS